MKRRVLVATSLALFACADSGITPSSGPIVSDSAGIRIVQTPPGDLVYAALAEEPSLSIGMLSGPEEFLFGRIASARRDAAGNLIVADRQALEIRIFDVEGSHLQSLGREGEGPGEFQLLSGAWPVSDRDETDVDSHQIIAVDSRLDRITRFSSEGTPLRTATLSDREGLIILPIGLGGSGAVLSRASPFNVPSPQSMSGSLEDLVNDMFAGEDNRRVLFVRHRFDGVLVDTVAEGKDAARGSVSSGSGMEMRVMTMTVPFSPQAAAAGSPSGVVVTGGAAYEISVFDEDGSLRMIARLDEAPPIRTDEHLETYARGSDRDEAEVRESIEQYRQFELPESLPGYTHVLFADEGELWARRYVLPGEPMLRWDVFANDGAYLGRVDVPASFRIEEVGPGQTLGVATDDLGFERVQLRDLTLHRP
ncbi:MAG: 6-bladed beta-propeller [Gemmatimonadetes bacterium]|nr:6-bladed beta-propeller [Gemmatimonadota bacterium]